MFLQQIMDSYFFYLMVDHDDIKIDWKMMGLRFTLIIYISVTYNLQYIKREKKEKERLRQNRERERHRVREESSRLADRGTQRELRSRERQKERKERDKDLLNQKG